MSAVFLIHKKFSQIMKLLSIGVQSHLNGFQLLARGHSHYVSHLQSHVSDLFLNTNNPVISKIFGYNNNVLIGNRLSSDIPDYDLIGAIYHMRNFSKISWSYRHVKGHQDDVTSDLDVWAQQNARMDAAAKQHIAIAKAMPRHFNIPGEPWQLWVEGRKITSKIQESIYSAVHRPESEAYWENKEGQKDGIALVDWKNIGYAMKKAPRTRRVFLTKHICGMCGLGKFMKRWKEWEEDACPRCGAQEDAPHVWLCKGQGTEDRWTKALQELENLLHQLDTDPTLRHIILVYDGGDSLKGG